MRPFVEFLPLRSNVGQFTAFKVLRFVDALDRESSSVFRLTRIFLQLLSDDHKLIINALNEFFEAMGHWEKECKLSYRATKQGTLSFDEATAQWIRSLTQVFREHCATDELPARTRHGIQFSLIPTYGPDLQEILQMEVCDDRAKVITRELSGTKDRLVYRLRKVANQWRVEDNRKRIDDQDKEVDWDL